MEQSIYSVFLPSGCQESQALQIQYMVAQTNMSPQLTINVLLLNEVLNIALIVNYYTKYPHSPNLIDIHGNQPLLVIKDTASRKQRMFYIPITRGELGWLSEGRDQMNTANTVAFNSIIIFVAATSKESRKFSALAYRLNKTNRRDQAIFFRGTITALH